MEGSIKQYRTYAVAPFCLMKNNILFTYTYGEYMKYIPGWQTFFTIFSHMFTPIPQCSREGDGGFAIFCIYFWKGWRGTWLRHGRVRHAIFSYHLLYPVHSTYYTTISVWWWSLLTIDVPHVDFHSTHVMISLLIIIVNFHLWRVPLMMIFLVLYTFILVNKHVCLSLISVN